MTSLPNLRARFGRHLGSSSFHWFVTSTFALAMARNGYAVACAWILVASGGGSASVAAFFATLSLTELLASPIAGWISDRVDRRMLVITADSVRCLAAAALAFTNAPLLIFWSATLFGCCDRIALTASQAMIPSVGRHLAPSTSNSVTFFIMQIGGLAAAACVGVLLHGVSGFAAFVVIASSFALSAGAMWLVTSEAGLSSISQSQERGIWSADPRLVRLGLVYAILYGGGLLVSIMGPGYVFDELSGDAFDFGALESAWSAGSIIGAVLLIPLARFSGKAQLLVAILFLTALLFACVKVATLAWSLLIFAALGAVYNFGRVAVEVTLQAITPAAGLGRVKGIFHCAGVSVGMIMFGLVSVSADRLLPSTVFLIYAAAIFMVAILLLTFCRIQSFTADRKDPLG